MKLSGGIDTYSYTNRKAQNERVNGEDCRGRKVRFLGKNGYPAELEFAKNKIKINQILTVKEVYVGRSSSTVVFEEIEGEYNTVMFEDVTE